LDEVIEKGALPVPFPVSAVAVVTKESGAGAVLVSLENIDVSISQVRVANR
jgi:hypothetical protein